jgi:hypothetical protein
MISFDKDQRSRKKILWIVVSYITKSQQTPVEEKNNT